MSAATLKLFAPPAGRNEDCTTPFRTHTARASPAESIATWTSPASNPLVERSNAGGSHAPARALAGSVIAHSRPSAHAACFRAPISPL